MPTASTLRIMNTYGLPLNTRADRVRIDQIKGIEDEIRFIRENVIPKATAGTIKPPAWWTGVASAHQRLADLQVEHARLTNRPVQPLDIDRLGHAQVVGSPLYPPAEDSTSSHAVVDSSTAGGNSSSGGMPTGLILAVIAGVVLLGKR